MMICSYLKSFWKIYNSAADLVFKWNLPWTLFLLLLFLSLTLREMPTLMLFRFNLIEKSDVWATSCGLGALCQQVAICLQLWEELCVNSTLLDIMRIMCTIYRHFLFPKWFLSNVAIHKWEDMYYFYVPKCSRTCHIHTSWVRCMGFLWLWTYEVRSGELCQEEGGFGSSILSLLLLQLRAISSQWRSRIGFFSCKNTCAFSTWKGCSCWSRWYLCVLCSFLSSISQICAVCFNKLYFRVVLICILIYTAHVSWHIFAVTITCIQHLSALLASPPSSLSTGPVSP